MAAAAGYPHGPVAPTPPRLPSPPSSFPPPSSPLIIPATRADPINPCVAARLPHLLLCYARRRPRGALRFMFAGGTGAGGSLVVDLLSLHPWLLLLVVIGVAEMIMSSDYRRRTKVTWSRMAPFYVENLSAVVAVFSNLYAEYGYYHRIIIAVSMLGGMVSQPGKLTNPFDMAFESDVEANDMFMDLTSLQATLPDPHVPTENTGNLTGSWISQNSSVPYIPSASQGTSSSESMTYWTPLWTDLDYQEVISRPNARHV